MELAQIVSYPTMTKRARREWVRQLLLRMARVTSSLTWNGRRVKTLSAFSGMVTRLDEKAEKLAQLLPRSQQRRRRPRQVNAA